MFAVAPGRTGRRPGRPERRRQVDPSQPRRRSAAPDDGVHRGVRSAPRAGQGAAREGRVRGAGHPAVPDAQRGGPPPPRRTAQSPLGRGRRRHTSGPAPAGTEAEGGEALRRPTGAARAHARAGATTRTAPARRARCQPGPAGPTGVPRRAHAGGRGARGHRRPLLARRLRPGTGVRLPRRAGRLPGSCGRRRRHAARHASPIDRRASEPRQGAQREPGGDRKPHRPAVDAHRPHRGAGAGPRWAVSQLGLEDLVLAYMSGASRAHPTPALEVLR